jgi:hypothetical protein
MKLPSVRWENHLQKNALKIKALQIGLSNFSNADVDSSCSSMRNFNP